MRFIGDVHGKWDRYKRILKNSPCPTIQVGDMGVGFRDWHGEMRSNAPYDLMKEGKHRFIRGNHDNPGVCRNHSQWIADGHIENGMMFIGGAFSIDWQYRLEGMSWWRDEELSITELNELLGKYEKEKPEVMVTHDCPETIAALMSPQYHCEFPSRTRQALNGMLEIHRPKVWLFGHWHRSFDGTVNGTRFLCLNELEVMDV